MTRMYLGRLVAALCALFSLAAASQPPPPALDGPTRAAIVQAATKALKSGYVFPEVGDKTAQALEAAASAGSYDTISQPSAFAQRLTADMRAVAHDKHLQVIAPGGPGPGAAGRPPVRSDNGVVRADLLSGQIGYLEVNAFPPAAMFKAPIDRAMASLEQTRALIIDARRHHGGNPDAEAYLVGYFLPKGAAPTVIDRFIWRNEGTLTFRTEDFPSSPTPFSYAGKPVYVLTSSETFSGGEAFAYSMKVMHLGKTVGETTGGGANPGGTTPLSAGFLMFLPRGRSNNPVTGTNWEGVGVKPDITTPSANALKVALMRLGQHPETSDIDDLSQQPLFRPHMTRQPGSEDAVRRIIGELQRGAPDYDLLGEGLAQVTRQQLPALHDLMNKQGALESVIFVEIDPTGSDVYRAKFANGSLRFIISLSPDGKAQMLALRPDGPPPPQ